MNCLILYEFNICLILYKFLKILYWIIIKYTCPIYNSIMWIFNSLIYYLDKWKMEKEQYYLYRDK